LINVLRGEMSLVGPRPEESAIVARFPEWYRERLAAKPGLTGPMQVNGRGDLSFEERAELEVKYIKKYRLWRDIVILIQTIPAVIQGKGAY
jgi:lipopolysaccharide/colanic/teichoic acid biosynthesis glycosyltransferase